MDELLSSPVYSAVEKVVICLEGDAEGYLNACDEFERKNAIKECGVGRCGEGRSGEGNVGKSPWHDLSPKRNLLAYLPKTMKMREGDNSVLCIMGGMVFYPLN